jgi:xanthine dehydrogenase accessory factor
VRPGGLEEYAYAPAAGCWQTERRIGEAVAAGDALGAVGGIVVRAPTSGWLRGLVHDAVDVGAGLKLAAVHPGDWQRKEAGIGVRAATIAASVLALAEQHAGQPAVVAS